MQQKEQKAANDKLRRNIWRSLLIMNTAPISELLGVVTGLNSRQAKALLRDLETHGYVGKNIVKGRPVYFRAVEKPSLPDVCVHCGRPFNTKACSPKQTKKETERDRETETQTKRARKKRNKRNRETAADIVGRAIREASREVNDDAA